MIAHSVHPPRKADGIANMIFVEIGTSVAAVSVHGEAPLSGRADTSRQGRKVKLICYFQPIPMLKASVDSANFH